MPRSRPWVVLQEGSRRRWGGDLRRAHIFAELAAATGATVGTAWTGPAVRSAIRSATGGRLRLRARPRPYLATAELLPLDGLEALLSAVEAIALDVHDDPLAQRAAFGLGAPDPALERRWRRNLEAFAWLVAPSDSFADLAALDPARRIIVPNGTDTAHIHPGPFPGRPVVGLVSGAAPGRGIESLVEAVRMVRDVVPATELRLWLAVGDEGSRAYRDELARRLDGDPWAVVEEARYEQLGAVLAGATVLVVPHPPGDYLDSALPVKLFDSMAAGRPVVVTPRREMAAVVARTGAGMVAAGDMPADLAAAIRPFLDDPELAMRAGAAGRMAVEAEFDWHRLSDGLARTLLARVS